MSHARLVPGMRDILPFFLSRLEREVKQWQHAFAFFRRLLLPRPSRARVQCWKHEFKYAVKWPCVTHSKEIFWFARAFYIFIFPLLRGQSASVRSYRLLLHLPTWGRTVSCCPYWNPLAALYCLLSKQSRRLKASLRNGVRHLRFLKASGIH